MCGRRQKGEAGGWSSASACVLVAEYVSGLVCFGSVRSLISCFRTSSSSLAAPTSPVAGRQASAWHHLGSLSVAVYSLVGSLRLVPGVAPRAHSQLRRRAGGGLNSGALLG